MKKTLWRMTADHELRNKNGKVTAIFSLIILCLTVAALVLPAVALSKKEVVMNCPLTVHEHTASCYQIDENGDEVLACGQADYVVHTHNEFCYDGDGNLICTLPEIEEHIHDESCYEEQQVLVCDLEENEDHTHTDECYTKENVLICGKDEVHTHDGSCFDADGNLTCTKLVLEAHQHDESCLKKNEASGEEPEADQPEDQPAVKETQAEDPAEDPAADQAEAEDSKDSDPTDSPDPEAENDKQVMTWTESTDKVTVYVEADQDAFPEGTSMQVKDVDDEETIQSVSEAVDGEIKAIKAVDISFYNADGKEIEPGKPIRVSMTTKRKVEEKKADLTIVHVDDAGKASEVKEVSVENKKKREEMTATFEAGEFSVYAVVYTVDFHYEVNGKKYDFSIPGGGYISLQHLVEVLGIAGGTNKENAETQQADSLALADVQISDSTREFVADVESVEFSSPELVWVGKVDSAATIGGLKEANDLEVEYSAELTEEQIEEINAQTVETGDWALISVKPFTSEESLTVTMKNGDQFVVRVTDEAVYNLTSGQNYVMYTTTTYGNWTIYRVLDVRGNYHDFYNLNDLDSLGDEYLWTATNVNGNWRFQSKSAVRGNDTLDYYTYLDVNSGHGNVNDVVVWRRPYETNIPLTYLQNNGNSTFNLLGLNWNGLALGWRDNYNNSGFLITNGDNAANMSFYRQSPTFNYTVITNDSSEGLVSGWSSEHNRQENNTDLIQSTTGTNKKNNTLITATPTSSKYMFSHWELDNQTVYANGTTQDDGTGTLMGSRIEPFALTFTSNNQVLKACFIIDPDITSNVPAKSFDEQALQDWYDLISRTSPPLSNVDKTAEAYDYENRIYQIDFTAASSVQTFASDIDLSFVMDVSNSMLFPATLNSLKDNQNHAVLKKLTPTALNSLPHNSGEVYFVVGDVGYTSTVYALWYDGQWKYADASEYAKQNSSRYYNVNGQIGGWNDQSQGRLNTTDEFPIYVTNQSYFDGINSNDIYSKNNPAYNRLYYMKDAMETLVGESKNIAEEAASVANPSGASNVRVAWEVFNRLHSNGVDFSSVTDNSADPSHPGQTIGDSNFNEIENALNNTETSGGTRQDRGLDWAINNFTYSVSSGSQKTKRIAILITDGAPMITGNDQHQNSYTSTTELNINRDKGYDYYVGTTGDGAWLRDQIRSKADTLKKGTDGRYGTDDDVTLITIGLGVDRVANAPEWLDEVASDLPSELQVTGGAQKYFYNVTDTSKLKYVLYDILQTFSASAIVDTDVTDVIDEAFYPVDENGNPLHVGDTYTAENGVTGTIGQMQVTQGNVTKTLWTVTWDHQAVNWSDHGGWHGSVLVKAKEDFLGGNDINTNYDSTVTANSFTAENSFDEFEPKVVPIIQNNVFKPETPYVNVHELQMQADSSEWTVYLGESVDPRAQLHELFKKIRVQEVVTSTSDDNGDNKPDHKINNGQMLGHEPNGEAETFLLSDVFEMSDDDFDYLLDYGIFFKPYDTAIKQAYGHTLGDGYDLGTFFIQLTRNDVANGEQDFENSPHITTVTNAANDGDPVEAYTLTVLLFPNGSAFEDTPEQYHTGNYVTGTPGREIAMVQADNNHVVNVYSKPLDIQKVGENDTPITKPATFELFRAFESGDEVSRRVKFGPDGDEGYKGYKQNGTVISGYYYRVDTQATDADGIAHFGAGTDLTKLLDKSKAPYILIEKTAPEGYEKDVNAKTITIINNGAGMNLYSDLDKAALPEAVYPNIDYPYNWNQAVQFKVVEYDDQAGTDKAPAAVDYVEKTTGEPIILKQPTSEEDQPWVVPEEGDPRNPMYVFSNIENSVDMIRDDVDATGVFQISFVNEEIPITIDIVKIEKDNDNVKLPGAVFELRQIKDDLPGIGGIYQSEPGTVTRSSDPTDNNGRTSFTNLTTGYYELSEKITPVGYVKTSELTTTYFKIETGVVTWLVKGTGKPSTWAERESAANDMVTFEAATPAVEDDGSTLDVDESKEATSDTFIVQNEPGAALPSAGGPGTTIFYILGFIFTAFAGIGLEVKRRLRDAA